MDFIIAAVLAGIFGGLQFFLLWKGVHSIAQGRIRVPYFVAQFLCPLAGLGLCVWLAKDRLILCATIICGILLVSTLAYITYTHKRDRKKV